jgi:hypothetical protein
MKEHVVMFMINNTMAFFCHASSRWHTQKAHPTRSHIFSKSNHTETMSNYLANAPHQLIIECNWNCSTQHNSQCTMNGLDVVCRCNFLIYLFCRFWVFLINSTGFGHHKNPPTSKPTTYTFWKTTSFSKDSYIESSCPLDSPQEKLAC